VIKDKLSQRLTANKNTSRVNKTSPDWQKHSEELDKHHEPEKKHELENSLGCSITSPVNNNDDVLEWNKNIPVIQDRISDKLDVERHQRSPVHQINTARNDSPVRGTSIDSNESKDSNLNDQCKDHLFQDFHDVNIDELNSDAKCYTNDNDERTGVDASNPDHDDDDDNNHWNNDDDHGDKDYIAESVLDPAQFINDIINDDISDNSSVSHNTDLTGFTENKRFGPTDVVNESQLRTSAFDIAHENIEHSNVGDSGDESLDSFFDCVTLKQRSEHGVELPDLSDVVQPHSVVSRKNLSKLRNIIHERMSEDEQTPSLCEQQNNNHKLDINNGESIQLCGDKKDSNPSVSSADPVKKTGIDQHQLTKPTFQEDNTFGTSYPFVQ
jgi:hypothetical protein